MLLCRRVGTQKLSSTPQDIACDNFWRKEYEEILLDAGQYGLQVGDGPAAIPYELQWTIGEAERKAWGGPTVLSPIEDKRLEAYIKTCLHEGKKTSRSWAKSFIKRKNHGKLEFVCGAG